jgi:glycosyltransferase involved in cell wall biosynthesis
VIIATHGRPTLLARAIRSVKAQGIAGVCVIVVADQRCAETGAVAQALLSGEDIYIERGGPPGPARSRTLGLQVTCAERVIFLDDDDELAPGFLAGVEACERNREVLYSDYAVVQDGVDRCADVAHPAQFVGTGARDPHNVYVMNFIPNSCLIYPRAAVAGRAFDESLILNEDWAFLLDVLRQWPLRHVPVLGPIIHKTERARADRRGAVNDYLLPEVLRSIYARWPAPTPALREARQRVFASAGISVPLDAC